jgi:uncharacterized membrane protein
VTARIRSSLLLFILLLAFALRVYRLDAQSIWYDEGLSIQLAQLPPDQTIALSATTDHPPLHALLLGAWIRIAGDSDFIVRLLSTFFGVLVVALIYKLGKILDERVGLIAAFLMSIAPMAVYYSQETRGYMLLTALILLAAIAFVQISLGHTNRWTWLIYGASIVAALYTHYFAAFAWIAFNVAWLINFAKVGLQNDDASRKPSQGFWKWIIAQLIIVACFLPWLPNAIAQAASNATYFPGRVTWDTVVGDTWRAFAVGEWGNGSIAGWLWLMLVTLGFIYNRRVYSKSKEVADNLAKGSISSSNTSIQPSQGIFIALLWLVVPLLLMSALAWLKPKFAPRYLLPSLPALVVLVSIGIRNADSALAPFRVSRLKLPTKVGVSLLCVLALTFFDAQSLSRLYNDPSIARPDVRSVAAYIQSHEQPSDAIVLIGGHQAPAFDHYYRGSNDVIPLPPDLLPSPQNPIDARSIKQLAEIASTHSHIWLVLWQSEISDPMNVVQDALNDQSPRLEVGQNFHDMALQLFNVQAARFEPRPQFETNNRFVQPIRLVGYNMNMALAVIGEPLSFGLYFSADSPIAGNYQIFTHLIAADGSIVAQQDHIAGADSYPSSLWTSGNLILNRFQIDLPNNLAPGNYRLEVGLYDSSGRLKLIDGSDHVNLVQLEIVR